MLFSAGCTLTGGQSAPSAVQATVAPQAIQATATNPAETVTAVATAAVEATATQTTAPPTKAAQVITSDEVIKTAQDAWAKLATAGPRHISQTAYKGDAAISTIEADSVPPNYHQVNSVMGTVMVEQYVYDGTIYNKVNGEWTQLPGGGKTFTNVLEGFAKGVSDAIVLADGQVVGIEVVNGKPATAYSYTSTLKGLDVKPAKYTIWVDNASGLPVKRVDVSPDGLKIVQLITYDATITVTLPDDAKNAKTANP